MFHYPKYGVVWSISRAALVATTVLLMLPFIALAVAPVMLLLLPLAFVALPFMIVGFFAGAAGNHMESRRIAAWRPLTVRAVA